MYTRSVQVQHMIIGLVPLQLLACVRWGSWHSNRHAVLAGWSLHVQMAPCCVSPPPPPPHTYTHSVTIITIIHTPPRLRPPSTAPMTLTHTYTHTHSLRIAMLGTHLGRGWRLLELVGVLDDEGSVNLRRGAGERGGGATCNARAKHVYSKVGRG